MDSCDPERSRDNPACDRAYLLSRGVEGCEVLPCAVVGVAIF